MSEVGIEGKYSIELFKEGGEGAGRLAVTLIRDRDGIGGRDVLRLS